MPSKNRVKVYVDEGYYHIYNRGVNKRVIFKKEADYRVFLNLLKRYLDDAPHVDEKGREYPWLQEKVGLMAYCLMPNHFHLLIQQKQCDGMTKLMRGVLTSYTTYFNKKYKRIGPLFQDVYKASLIETDVYMIHISRYIHLNPNNYKTWEYSSYKYFVGDASAAWVDPGLALQMLEGDSYEKFMDDYKDYRETLDDIGAWLAHE